MAATTRVVWSDRAISTLLEVLRDGESLWNTKYDSYENRNIKKKYYDKILQILKDDNFPVDLQSVKGTVRHST